MLSAIGPLRSAAVRLRYGILAVITVALGVAVHLHGHGLPSDARDVLGDALWASMIYWIVSVATPAAARPWRILATLGVCFVVELSQLIHTEGLTAVRSTLIGHLVLGSDFDPRDLVAYSAGVAGAALVDHLISR